jgi:uncharacterized membrane protein
MDRSARLRQLLAACVSIAVVFFPSAAAPSVAVGQAFSAPWSVHAYDCADGFSFTAELTGHRGRLHYSSRSVEIERVRAASGAKYKGPGIVYWSKGRTALLKVAGRTHQACRLNHRRSIWQDARLRGVDFRAVGQEPGWLLEISRRDQIFLLADYGDTTVEFPYVPPAIETGEADARYALKNDSHQLLISLWHKPCRDAMSGEPYPVTVMLELDGRVLRGCGRALR